MGTSSIYGGFHLWLQHDSSQLQQSILWNCRLPGRKGPLWRGRVESGDWQWGAPFDTGANWPRVGATRGEFLWYESLMKTILKSEMQLPENCYMVIWNQATDNMRSKLMMIENWTMVGTDMDLVALTRGIWSLQNSRANMMNLLLSAMSSTGSTKHTKGSCF